MNMYFQCDGRYGCLLDVFKSLLLYLPTVLPLEGESRFFGPKFAAVPLFFTFSRFLQLFGTNLLLNLIIL